MAEIKDPIVSMVEFQGRLWLATSKGVFVKRRNEDVFAPVEMIPAPESDYADQVYSADRD